MTLTPSVDTRQPASLGVRRLWRRELEHYPAPSARRRYLGLAVLSTVSLYYMAFIQGAVGPSLVGEFHLTFFQLVLLGIIGNGVGALASLVAGLADRWGRANMVVGGMLISAALTTFAIPHAPTKAWFFVLVAALGFVEGAVLVASPALVRDFSPQVGRGQAMGMWTLGPVLGSLIVTFMASHTQSAHPDWRWQFYAAGITGFAVAGLALVGLRELSPPMRDQIMGSERERVLVEARAAGLDLEVLGQNHWKQMLKPDILGPALGISLFLLFYYALVGFLVVYFVTVFGWTEAKANGLGNWYWASNAIGLVVVGFLSDKLRVRKPFMVGGMLIGLVGNIMFAVAATDPHTSYSYLVASFVLSAFGGGIAYVAWMAAFTETVEARNPAATATGLAVWGWTLRTVVTISVLILTLVVPATAQIVDHGPRVQEIATKYAKQVAIINKATPYALQQITFYPNDPVAPSIALANLTGLDISETSRALNFKRDHETDLATAQMIPSAALATLSQDPTNSAALTAALDAIATKANVTQNQALQRLLNMAAAFKAQPNELAFLQAHAAALTAAGAQLQTLKEIPAADMAYLSAHAADVVQAQKDQAAQWQHWWWVTIAGQLLFLPLALMLRGRWSPKTARQEAEKREARIDSELAALAAGTAPKARTESPITSPV